MASKHNSRGGGQTEPAATAVRYFELYEDLSAGGTARAYPFRYDRKTSAWKKIDISDAEKLPRIADRFQGTGGKSTDVVQCVWMAGSRRWELIMPVIAIHRGETNAQLNKGSTAAVKRFNAGTDVDSGKTDSVFNDIASVPITKKVVYVQMGAAFYLLAGEKTLQTLLSNMRIKSGNTQVEAEKLDIYVDSVDTAAYSDKIPLTSC